MKAIHIDAKTGNVMSVHDVQWTGAAGFCSWRRLSEIFRAADEIKSCEEIISFQIDERGIIYRIIIK